MKTKHLLFALLSILFIYACNEKPNGCKSMKTGKFEYIDTLQNQSYGIERNDSIQIEYNYSNNTKSIFRIKWINDCEYTLQLDSSREEMTKFYDSKLLHVKILEVYPDGYRFSAILDGYDQVLIQTFKRVKE